MSVLINADTKVIVQGITGRAGTFYTDMAVRYGSQYVGGVRPGKGGSTHIGLPVFDTVAEAVKQTQPDASLILVPAHKAADAMIDAAVEEAKSAPPPDLSMADKDVWADGGSAWRN